MPGRVVARNPDGSPRLTVWTKSDPDPENPLLALIEAGRMSPGAIRPSPSLVSTVTPRGEDPWPARESAPESPTPGPTVPLVERLNLLVFSCDYRGRQLTGLPGGCGCNPTWHCGLSKGAFQSNPNQVSKADCYRCVLGQLPEPAAAG